MKNAAQFHTQPAPRHRTQRGHKDTGKQSRTDAEKASTAAGWGAAYFQHARHSLRCCAIDCKRWQGEGKRESINSHVGTAVERRLFYLLCSA